MSLSGEFGILTVEAPPMAVAKRHPDVMPAFGAFPRKSQHEGHPGHPLGLSFSDQGAPEHRQCHPVATFETVEFQVATRVDLVFHATHDCPILPVLSEKMFVVKESFFELSCACVGLRVRFCV